MSNLMQPQPTTVIVDFSVMCHQLHNQLNALGLEKEYRSSAIQAQMVYLHSGVWVEQLIGHQNFNLVYVKDTKPYWRKDYLLQQEVYEGIAERAWLAYKERYPTGRKKQPKAEPIHYKAGRKFPNGAFTTTKRRMTTIAGRKEFTCLAFHGYEADDVAAAIVMNNRMRTPDKQRKIILATVDTDWMGLIDNNTTWFCVKGFDPRIRSTMDDINGWALRRLGTTLSCPSDIWRVKTIQGDKSDNLPPGSPIEVIDLTQPPMDKRLWLDPVYKPILDLSMDNDDDRSELPLEKATDYLRLLGIQPFIKPYLSYGVAA